MSKFSIETEALNEAERAALQEALSPLAESDLPLVVEFLLVDEAEIERLNREQRNIDSVTDVLSFPAMELVRGEPIRSEEHGECVETVEDGGLCDRLYLGSVVVCKKRAEEQAEEYGHSYARELCYLFVHGVLHCLGYDHETEEERAEMRAKEEFVMKRLGLERKA